MINASAVGKSVHTKLSVRKGNFTDIELIHSLDERLFSPGVSFDVETLYFHLLDPASVTYIAELDGEIAGFVIFKLETPKSGTIVTIDVAPEHQGIGIGARMMNAVDRLAERSGVVSITLQVSVNNSVAQGFYKKRGYVKTRRLKGYYSCAGAATGAADDGDAWEMRRRIKRNTPAKRSERMSGS